MEQEVTFGEQQVQAIYWFTDPTLTVGTIPEPRLLTNKELWKKALTGGCGIFKSRFNKKPVKVILHTHPLPDGWEKEFPDIEFRYTKSIPAGHYVLCNDPDEFFGKEKKELDT